MKLIVAVDEKWGIGRDNDLLLSIPDDMRYFREKTRGKILVMGYNTLLSFPGSKPLPGRLNIVLNNEEGCRVSGAVVCDSIEQMFRLLGDFNGDDIYVIGGASIYRQLLPYCDTAYITKMRFNGQADVFIPDLDKLDNWSVWNESELMEHDGIEYSFVEYRNSDAVPVDYLAKSSDMSAYFKKKEPAKFSLIDRDDEGYIAGVCALLRAYYKPLRDGFSASQVAEYLDSGSPSFEKYLRDKGMIAAEDDFYDYRESHDNGEAATRVRVAKEDVDRFAGAVAGGCTVKELAEFFAISE